VLWSLLHLLSLHVSPTFYSITLHLFFFGNKIVLSAHVHIYTKLNSTQQEIMHAGRPTIQTSDTY